MKKLDLRYNLKCILKERDMSQVTLAEKIGISATNLNTRLARGRNCQLSLLEEICKELDTDLNQLVFGTSTDKMSEHDETVTRKETDMLYKEKYIAMLEDNQRLHQELAEVKDKLYMLTKAAPQSRKRGNGE